MSAPLRFDEIARELQTGREIEFTFDGKHYSITNNSSGRWCFCVDTNAGSFLLEDLCPFGQLELLTTKIADTVLEGVTIRTIFDELLYDPSSLWIL